MEASVLCGVDSFGSVACRDRGVRCERGHSALEGAAPD